METVHSLTLLVAVTAPLLAALAIALTPGRLAELWSYLAAIVTLTCTVVLAGTIYQGMTPVMPLITLVPGLDLELRVDYLGLTFGLLASGLWLISTLYSSGYVRADRHMKNRQRYFAFFAASIGTALGVAFASNLFTFLLFYEALTLATYPLVAHKETPEAVAGSRRYLAFTLSGGLILTLAVVWTWTLTGQLDFVPGGFLAGQAPGTLAVLFALFMVGCGVKAAIMPLHSWLPSAMVAPTPVSALLHAVAVVKAGAFGCIRILGFVFGPEALAAFGGARYLLAFCAVTIIAGSLIALSQDNLKLRLAYSTVVHLSYIVLGAALLSPLGAIGAVVHLVNHGLSKITLFFCAGVIYTATDKENISQFKGLGRRMPWTFGMFTVASLSLIGVPGLCGFVGKFFLGRGAVETNDLAYLAVLLGASLLTSAYLLPVVVTAFFDQPEDQQSPAGEPQDRRPTAFEAHPALLFSLAAAAFLVVVFGLIPPLIGLQVELAGQVASSIFGGLL
jgi:multicomponent Na+:H+ antiporter subunit D